MTGDEFRSDDESDPGVVDDPVADASPDAGAEEDFDTEIDTDIEADDAEQTMAVQPDSPSGLADWRRVVVFAVLPALALLLGAGAGFLGWKSYVQRGIDAARTESVAAAREATVTMLSYRADTVEQDLMAARDRITGVFLDSYTDLVNNTVIPMAREQDISSQTRVPAAASVSAEADRAVVLVFVNQSITVGADAPTGTASSVRVTMEKVDGRWLVTGFDPV